MSARITRTQLWQRNYSMRPYLKDATDSELAHRMRCIIENVTTLTPRGQIGLLSPEPHGKFWFELMTHAQTAYRERGLPPPDFLKGAMVPKPTFPAPPSAVKALEAILPLQTDSYLVKFGMKAHMFDLHRYGRFRIAPASNFNDPSLNAAIRDDELQLSGYSLRSEIRMEALDPKTGQSKGLVEPIGNVTVTSRSTTNYYVVCLSRTTDIRLFGDFGYDACVIFRKPGALAERLFQAVEMRLPQWVGQAAPIRYVDPYNFTKPDLNVFMGKHLRYWYQREFRFWWMPPSEAMALSPFFVELGDLTADSDLIIL